MKDNKVKISNILGSLIPDFIENDTTAGEESLFKQFLTQYYNFEEREYGTTDIAENIAFNKKISTLSKMETVRAQTIPAVGTTVPSEQIRVNGEVFAYDNLINVNHTPSQQTDSPMSFFLKEILEAISMTKLARTYFGLFFILLIRP